MTRLQATILKIKAKEEAFYNGTLFGVAIGFTIGIGFCTAVMFL